MRLIGRRDFVRGLGLGATASLLTPFSRALLQQAQGQDHLLKPRMILMLGTQSFGQHSTRRWVPRNSDLTANNAFAPGFEPLAPWGSKTLIIDYLYNPFNKGQHGCGWATLSVRGDRTTLKGGQQSRNHWPDPTGITFDVYAAEHLSTGAPFRMLAARCDQGVISCDANLNPMSFFSNANELYKQTFGSFQPPSSDTDPDAIRRLQRRISVLDLANQDLKRMRSRLAGPEREKLDQMEASIVEMEDQLRALNDNQVACTKPGEPSVGGPGGHGGTFDPRFLPAMTSIQTAALICRLTNVVVFTPIAGRRTYEKILGFEKQLTNNNGDPVQFYVHNMAHADDYELLQRVDAYHAKTLVKMMDTLNQVPEGDGTMADRTLGVWYDKGGGKHHDTRGQDTHPIILLGDMNGHFKSGRHVRYAKGEHATSDAFVSILQALGIQTDTFGDSSECKGPLPGLT